MPISPVMGTTAALHTRQYLFELRFQVVMADDVDGMWMVVDVMWRCSSFDYTSLMVSYAFSESPRSPEMTLRTDICVYLF